MGNCDPHGRAIPDFNGPAGLPTKAIEWIAGAISTALLIATAGQAVAAPLPILVGDVVFASTNSVQSFTVDLGTLPTRPILAVSVTPDATDATMQLEITATNWQGTSGPGNCKANGSSSPPSTSGPGVATYQESLFNCDPRPGAFAGDTVTIQVRAVHFGSGAPPATVSVEIRGVTRPPTTTLSQEVDTDLSPQQLVFPAVRDTVLYEDDTDASNGAGQFLWAGERATLFPPIRSELRSLVAFNVTPAITPVSEIDAAVLRVGVTSVLSLGGTLRVYSLAPDQLFQWPEGNAAAAGTELIGATSTFSAADWLFRQRATRAWLNPGGDVLGSPLAQLSITTTGTRSLSSTALAAAVQTMVSTGNSRDGFLLAGPAASTFISTAIQLASSENTSGAQRPELVVDFTPSEPYETGNVSTNVVTFIDEGQDFRWIYDLDQDDIYVTPIDGVCEALTDLGDRRTMPYTYRYQGTPGFTGVDCCTWRIEAQQAGVVGSGQALFFHNLDPGNPAHMPPDTDRDGIRDLCDNCPSIPNGPLAGVCLAGPMFRAPCLSNAACGSGGICSLSQEDSNGDFQGDACVPEPGLGVGLLAGMGLISWWSRCPSRRRG